MKLSDSHKEILRLAIPSIITNITVPILGLFNVAISGHIGNAEYIAAIAVGGNIFNMLYWLLNFLRAGSSGLVSQAHGAKNYRQCAVLLYRALLLSLVLGAVLILFRQPVGRAMLLLFNVPADTESLALRYYNICVLGAPAVLATFSLAGWLLGCKNTKRPMWIYLFVNVANILLSLVLVFVLGMNVEGIAVGAVVAQWLGVALGLWLSRREIRNYKISFGEVLLWKEFRRFFSVNVDVFFRTLCLVSVTVWFIRMGASQGSVVLAVNAILMQMYLLYTYAYDGFAFAGESLSGNYFGAGEYGKFCQTVKDNFKWNFAVVVLFIIAFGLFGTNIVGILTDDPAVVAEADKYIWWTVAMIVAGSVAFTWDGIYIGTTTTRPMLLTTFLSMLTFFAVNYLLFPVMGNNGLWLAFVANLFVRSLVETLLAKRWVYGKVKEQSDLIAESKSSPK